MHVPIEHHRRAVHSLGWALFVLIALLAMAIVKIGPFAPNKEQFSVAKEYLKSQEVFIIAPEGADAEPLILPIQKVLFEYVEVTGGCGSSFQGECLNARSGPGEEYPSVAKLRNGIVLKVGGKVERDGRTWYNIIFDERIRYPERVSGDWYVAADYVRVLLDEGERNFVEQVNIKV